VSNRRNPLIIAHRGAGWPARHPENTVAAFRRARAVAADWVELDVRRTADGQLAVHHDARLADGRLVSALTRSGLPSRVPDLHEALAACMGLGVNVEIKNLAFEPDHDPQVAVAAAVVTAVREADPPVSVLVSSFDRATIDRVHALAPSLPTALLTYALDDAAATIGWCVAHGHRALHPFDATVDHALVAAAHDHGLAVNVWTVDQPERIAALAALGVDGICTNVPDLARRVFENRGAERRDA
jgi:glycerophosphoryl diester phosphodiesterase